MYKVEILKDTVNFEVRISLKTKPLENYQNWWIVEYDWGYDNWLQYRFHKQIWHYGWLDKLTRINKDKIIYN